MVSTYGHHCNVLVHQYGATWHWHKVKGYWKILLGSSWLPLVLNLAMIWMIRILVAQKVNNTIIMELISLIHCTYQLARKLSSAWIALSRLWKPGSRGPYLESPGNFSGPKSSIQIKIWRKGVRVLASKLLHFVSLTNSFIRRRLKFGIWQPLLQYKLH